MNILICVYPNAYVYCDKDVEENGDYLTVGVVYFSPLSFKIFNHDKKYTETYKQIKEQFEALKQCNSVQISVTGQQAAINYIK